MPKLTRKGFIKWLKEQSPRKRAGFRNSPHNCPIARYLGDGSYVGSAVYYLKKSGNPRTLPIWAQAFVKEVDQKVNGALRGSITFGHCLKILGE